MTKPLGRTRLNSSFAAVALGLVVALCGTSVSKAENTRFAIVSDSASASLEALLAARLSDLPSVSLLERTDLDELLSEKSLSALGKKIELAGADFLIVLEGHEDTDPPLIGARIVESATGSIALFRVFPGGETGKGGVDLISQEAARLAGRESSPEEAKDTSVALLGFRFELPQKEHPAREYALNQIIASTLHSAPGLRVLERWQSEALLFERIAKAADNDPVETGAILVDGTLSEGQGKVRLTLRLRAGAEGETTKIEIERNGEDFMGVADEVVAVVLNRTHSAPVAARDPKVEADLQVKLSNWAMVNGLAEESVAAAETAMALSPVDPVCLLASAKAYAFRAWPNPPAMDTLGYTDHFPNGFEPAPHLRDALQALNRLDDLDRVAAKSALPEGFPELEKESLRTTFDLACLCRRIQQGGLRDTVLVDFRALQDRLRGKVETLSRSSSLEIRTDVGFGLIAWPTAWSPDAASAFDSMDELLKMDLGPNHYRMDPVRSVLADALFIEFGIHGTRNYLPQTGRLLPDPKTKEQDRAVWLEKAEEMIRRESVRDQITGSTILLALTRADESRRARALEEVSKLAWEHRQLLTSEEAPFLLSSMKMLFLELSDGTAPAPLSDFNRRFLTYILEEVEKPSTKCFELFSDELLSWKAEDAVALATLISKKREKAAAGGQSQNRTERSLQYLATRMQPKSTTRSSTAMVRGNGTTSQQPAPAPAPPSPPGALRVTQWMSPAAAVYGSWARYQSYEDVTREDSGELWTMNRHLLIRFSEDTPDSPRHLFLPKVVRSGFISFAVLPKHVAVTLGGEVWIVDKDNGNWWERVPLPVTEYHLSSSNGRLFMIYRPAYNSDDRESGILSYDPETREVSVITSSRKEASGIGPDGRADWEPRHAFLHGNAVAVAGELVSESGSAHQLYLQTGDQSWSRPLGPDSLIGQQFSNGDGGSILTLGAGNYIGASDTEQVVFFPAGGGAPELLARLASPRETPFYDTKPALPGEPRWIIPDALCQVDRAFSRKCSAIYHDGRLYLTSADFDRQSNLAPINRYLHVFDRDGSVRSLPLDFAPDNNAGSRPGLSNEHLEHLRQSCPVPTGIIAGADGLILCSGHSNYTSIEAIWKIPFSEIDALLQTTAPAPPSGKVPQ